MPPKVPASRDIEALQHKDARRKHIPTAETQSYVTEEEARPKKLRYPRNPDLDPQLVWRGKDEQDADDLYIDAAPVYIQEKIKPQAIIDDLKRRSDAARRARSEQDADFIPDMFHDFNGLPDKEAEFEFYQHDKNWANRMILGDSLMVMASLAEKEALRGQVQCIYLDPPYGIKFNSNFQPSTKSRDVKDGKIESLTREPEMIRAFRDTWKDGVHTYLSYVRDRLIVARDLLHESGSIFVQIGEDNVHLIRGLMDEVFGSQNYIAQIVFQKTGGQSSLLLSNVNDFVVWFSKNKGGTKYHQLYKKKQLGVGHGSGARYDQTDEAGEAFQLTSLTSNRPPGSFPVAFEGRTYGPSGGYWKTGEIGFPRLIKAGRIHKGGRTLRYKRYLNDFPAYEITNSWPDTAGSGDKIYVVQTSVAVVERCILMATDPGDLVLDPTCGSGTTAFVAEQWGRRWITIDTSRVALALARQRLMAARFPSYLLRDSEEGSRKEAELSKSLPTEGPFTRSIRRGFVYERVPHITLKAIANNTAIDVIWEGAQQTLTSLLDKLNGLLEEAWEEWEVPREAADEWSPEAKRVHAAWLQAYLDRQEEINASIAMNGDTEYLVDRPYEDRSKVRVTGPFSVESLSPHRVLSTDDEEDILAEELAELSGDATARRRTKSLTRTEAEARAEQDFTRVVLENLKKSGVQNTKKGEALIFTELKPWPGGRLVHAEGRYQEGDKERRVAVCIGPEYGTVSWGLVREAAREAIEAFDTLVVCGFAFEPRVNEESLGKFGRLTVLKARMNADLHMAGALKPTGAGNLFVVFGEPDIKIAIEKDDRLTAEILGVDIFDPTTGEVRSSDVDDIACWFIDTDYDEESFFVRQAYFLGGNDPYKRLKITLKAEIDEDAWATLYSAKSRPFERPTTGKIAVKVINHYGDEVLKVFGV
ncbi:site-specific DNA-methyltransferase [Bradyrhizobium japonicum]|uniref:site-specific DNA-methyltransferase n=1 Tax=Bradyrhizobium japonicum TaxID=375 RepID=UPI0003FD3FFC|nr:site-specific DNA-methyltransferase [Bradyrhizobium japonicum]